MHYKTIESMDGLLSIRPRRKEPFTIDWDPKVLRKPFFQDNDGNMETAASFSRYIRELGKRTGYTVPPTIHDFRAEGLYLIGNLSISPNHAASIDRL